MIKQFVYLIAPILLLVLVLQPQRAGQAPFASLERAVKEEEGGWAGDKRQLSTVFDAERKRLGDRFESELLKWLGTDPERHYWISGFLEEESYLHGSKRLPHLSLLVIQQGLALVEGKDDRESLGYVVRLSITAAILSDELGFSSLASSYKNEAEAQLLRRPDLSVFVPAGSETELRRYDGVKSSVTRKMTSVAGDGNQQPAARVSGGILNNRALNKIMPVYPASALEAGASGAVEVRVVFDETGKVIWAKAYSGHPQLRQVAEDAAWQTRFTPTILSGEAVRTSGVMLYNFVR
jgi:TonB family protein